MEFRGIGPGPAVNRYWSFFQRQQLGIPVAGLRTLRGGEPNDAGSLSPSRDQEFPEIHGAAVVGNPTGLAVTRIDRQAPPGWSGPGCRRCFTPAPARSPQREGARLPAGSRPSARALGRQPLMTKTPREDPRGLLARRRRFAWTAPEGTRRIPGTP